MGWAIDIKQMICRVDVGVPRPAEITQSIENAALTIARECFQVALATGAFVFTATPSPEIAGRLAAAIASTKPVF